MLRIIGCHSIGRSEEGEKRSDCGETLVDNLESQFQPVTDPSFPAVIQTVDVVLRSYFLIPASEPHFTTPDDVHDAIRGLKVRKAPGPCGLPNRVVKHLPKRSVSLLARIFNAVLRTHHLPPTWKHARVISILKPVKDPALPSSYQPISVLDTIGKLFEKILPVRILQVVNERGLLRDAQFGFRPKHSTSLQLARLVERITRNFGEKRLTGGFPRRGQSLRYRLDRWPPLQSNAHQLPVLQFTYHLILPQIRTFEAPFETATSSRRSMRAGVAQGD